MIDFSESDTRGVSFNTGFVSFLLTFVRLSLFPLLMFTGDRSLFTRKRRRVPIFINRPTVKSTG
ncbi:hypothetical protein BDZ91DRAFT_724557 [Kalaharituber pfeilii]|nr:hypothetical protein BDZ91DRAFT_724557 [Kalaharituber pfeilii]